MIESLKGLNLKMKIIIRSEALQGFGIMKWGGRSYPSRLGIVLALIFFMAAGWTSVYAGDADYLLAKKRDPEYDKIYSYYVEVSAVSRLRPLNKPEGGGWGHVLMYIKGACLDQTKNYPQLKLCDETEVDLHSPEAGVGVSVDKMFKTVNWMAVPGKQLFYEGNLAEGERVTQERLELTAREALRKGVFRGIQFYDEYLALKPQDLTDEEWIARQTLGTDYAIKFSRTSLCARLPVTKDLVEQMIQYLNARNEEIFTGKAKFNWSAYYDNCAHTVHNALARAGLWKFKKLNQNRIKQFFNKAIPANEFADLARLGENQPGALLKIIPAHKPNDLFGTEYELFVMEGPLRKPTTKKIRKMLAEPRHTDLEANLLYYKKRDEDDLKRPSGVSWCLSHLQYSEKDCNELRLKIKTDLDDRNQKLQTLAKLKNNSL